MLLVFTLFLFRKIIMFNYQLLTVNLVKMRYVAAYLLATLGGNASPDEKAVTAILSSVGIEADKTKLAKVNFLEY